ncbi:MAG: flagellar basal body protein FliL, partial [Pseudomonadota bacterium]
MAAVDSEEIEAPKKASKLPLLLGLVGALALGGGGFYATYSGLILGDAAATEGGDTAGADDADSLDAGASGPSASEVSYIEVEPMIVSLGSAGRGRH